MIYLTINPAVAKSIFWRLKKEDFLTQVNSIKDYLLTDEAIQLQKNKRICLINLLEQCRIIYKKRFF